MFSLKAACHAVCRGWPEKRVRSQGRPEETQRAKACEGAWPRCGGGEAATPEPSLWVLTHLTSPPAPRGPHLLSSLHYRFSLWPPNRSLWLWILWQRQNQYVVKIVASFLPQICQIQILETKHVKFSVSILMLLVNFLATYSCPYYKFFLNVWFFAFKFHI